jgi:hypothetical protein
MGAQSKPSLGRASWALNLALLAIAACSESTGVAPGEAEQRSSKYNVGTCEAGPCDGGVVDAGTPCQNSTQLDGQFRVASAPIVAEWDDGGAAGSASTTRLHESYLAVVGAAIDYPPPPPQQQKGCRCPQVQVRCNAPDDKPSACSPVECWISMSAGECTTLGYTDGQNIDQSTTTPVVFISYPGPPPPPWPTMPIVKAKCMLRHEGVHACQQLGAGLWCQEKDAFSGDQACVQSGMDDLGCGKGPWDVPSDCNDLNNDKTRDGILLAYMTCRCGGKTQDQCLAECKGDGKKPVRNAYCDQIAATYEPQAKAFPKTQTPQSGQ